MKCLVLRVLTDTEMIIYGAGGHAKVVFDSLLSQEIELKAIFDDNTSVNSFMGYEVITPYLSSLFANEKIIIAIGSNKTRHELSKSVKHAFGSTIHKTAFLAVNSEVNQGTMVLSKSVIQTESQIGKHTIINTGAIVEHDCIIEDFVHIGPGAVICGNVKVGTGAFIGANATILPGISIGKWAIIGAGSVVMMDVADGSKLAGNPAKVIFSDHAEKK